MRDIDPVCVETNPRSPRFGTVFPNRAAQHRESRFECIENRALRHDALYLQLDLAAATRERLQVMRQMHTNHGIVCTSTERTGGRSRTMGIQWSPASAEA